MEQCFVSQEITELSADIDCLVCQSRVRPFLSPFQSVDARVAPKQLKDLSQAIAPEFFRGFSQDILRQDYLFGSLLSLRLRPAILLLA
jgi:hypothetical protein